VRRAPHLSFLVCATRPTDWECGRPSARTRRCQVRLAPRRPLSMPSASTARTAPCSCRLRHAPLGSAPCSRSRARSGAAPTTSCANSRRKPPERIPVTIVRDTKAPPHGHACRALLLRTDSAPACPGWNEPRQPRSDLPRRYASAEIGMGHQPRTKHPRSPPPQLDSHGPSHIGLKYWRTSARTSCPE
jgi:hypothetical protein